MVKIGTFPPVIGRPLKRLQPLLAPANVSPQSLSCRHFIISRVSSVVIPGERYNLRFIKPPFSVVKQNDKEDSKARVCKAHPVLRSPFILIFTDIKKLILKTIRIESPSQFCYPWVGCTELTFRN